MRLRFYAAALLALITLPFFVFAQTDLQSEIRADLLNDPRTAEMSEAEIDALVAALANEAVETGVAGEYIDAKNTPDFSTFFTDPVVVPVVDYSISPLTIAVMFFSIVLLVVAIYVMRRGRRVVEAEADAAV